MCRSFVNKSFKNFSRFPPSGHGAKALSFMSPNTNNTVARQTNIRRSDKMPENTIIITYPNKLCKIDYINSVLMLLDMLQIMIFTFREKKDKIQEMFVKTYSSKYNKCFYLSDEILLCTCMVGRKLPSTEHCQIYWYHVISFCIFIKILQGL